MSVSMWIIASGVLFIYLIIQNNVYCSLFYAFSYPLLVQENTAQNFKTAFKIRQISPLLCYHNIKITLGKLAKWQFPSIHAAARGGKEGSVFTKQLCATFSNRTYRSYGHITVSLRNIFPSFTQTSEGLLRARTGCFSRPTIAL